jgi:hypothetical protein
METFPMKVTVGHLKSLASGLKASFTTNSEGSFATGRVWHGADLFNRIDFASRIDEYNDVIQQINRTHGIF